jgi:hypothetical protein
MVFAAVAALHAGLVITLIVTLRTPTRQSSADDFVSALIFLSTPLPPTSLSRRRPVVGESTAPVPVEPPVTSLPEIGGPADAETSIDWHEEAHREAAVVTGAHRFREFGQIPKADLSLAPHSSPAHTAGEQYRDEDGTWIVWVSPHCFIVSALPPLGLPDILARSMLTRTECQRDAESQGYLFKDLPAFGKYHPQ